GHTLYTNLASAYDRLSGETKIGFARLRTRSQTGVAHSLVIRHPVTDRVGLYVNLSPDAVIVDAAGNPVPGLIEDVRRHLDRENTFYRHVWRAGDMMVVDNFAAAHHATPAHPRALRVLHRTAIHGPSAWWRLGRQPHTEQPRIALPMCLTGGRTDEPQAVAT